jgi:hypothetical protein
MFRITPAEPDLEWVDRRKEVRVVVRIPGRFSLASRHDSNGKRRQFACRAINMSQSMIILATPIAGPIGERVIAYFEEFGKIQGSIVRVLDGALVVRIAASSEERHQLLRKLIWIEQNNIDRVSDMREQKRIIPEEPISTLVFPDGSMLRCFVIDMSASGVAVSADVIPLIGSVVAVGKVTGQVVRHFEEGFAIRFRRDQDPAKIERLVMCKL